MSTNSLGPVAPVSDVVIFGTGQIADVLSEYVERFGSERIVGYTVDRAYQAESHFRGLPVVAWEDLPAVFPPSSVRLLGPISYQGLNSLRRDRHLEAKSWGYQFANFIHPSVHLMADSVGENVIILENCTIQPRARLGDGVIIWSATHVGHHSVIGDFCFLSSQVGVSSGVSIGAGCVIGGQVGIDNGCIIGSDCYIESRAAIRRDVPPNSVVRHPYDRPERYSSERIRRMSFR